MFKHKKIKTGSIYYSDLIPELEHFFTTKETVLRSKENIDEVVSKNFEAVCEYLKMDRKNLISPSQTHSANIEFAKEGINNYPETDALILTNYEQAVYLNFADCVPVILYDKKFNIGAVAHAGWRSTASSIVPKAVNKMIEYSNSLPENIYAVIGPAIGICCYNVGDEVINGIKNTVDDSSNLFRFDNGKVFVDLKQTNAKQLIELGVPPQNIDICPYCTSCMNDVFFSYRKENGTTSRHSAVIKLLKLS